MFDDPTNATLVSAIRFVRLLKIKDLYFDMCADAETKTTFSSCDRNLGVLSTRRLEPIKLSSM